MKKTLVIIAFFLVSFAAVANSVFPHVWNNGHSVTFDAWNTSDRQVRCSGPIYMRMNDNSQDTIHIHEYLWPRQSMNRTYYPNSVGKTIQSVSHGVFCW